MIELHNLTKSYGADQDLALDSVSFDICDGEIIGFIGLNGAGKTTLIRIAAGVAFPSSGTALIDGFDIVSKKIEASKRLGWVPEFPNYEMGAKALSLMKYFCGFYRLNSQQANARSTTLLEEVGLKGSENKKLRTFSQGMKKRFSLAAAMIANPRNYLLDETLNGLDPEGIQYLRNRLLKMKRENKAILLSSHALNEVQTLADRIVLLHQGKLVRILTREEAHHQVSDFEELFFKTIGQTV